MMMKKKTLVSLASAVLGLTLATGCADPGSAAPASSSSPNSPAASNLSPEQSAVLTQLQSQAQDSFYLARATQAIMQQCLNDRGVKAYPSAEVTDPAIGTAAAIATPEAYAWWYEGGTYPTYESISPSLSMADQVGYGASVAADSSATSLDQQYGQLTRAQQTAVQKQIDGKDLDGNQVTPFNESCRGEVFKILYGGQPINFGMSPETMSSIGGVISGVKSAAIQKDILSYGSVDSAIVEWSDCMSKSGQPDADTAPAIDNTPASTRQGAAAQSPLGGGPSPADLATAKGIAQDDAKCASTADLNSAYQKAVQEWEIDQIKAHYDALAQYFKVRAPQVAAAKEYLGVK